MAVTPLPTLQFTASPTTISSGASATLSWTSTNATSCAAAGAWSGARQTSGSQGTGALSTTSTFDLTCSGAGGTVTGFATVTVTSPAPSVTLRPRRPRSRVVRRRSQLDGQQRHRVHRVWRLERIQADERHLHDWADCGRDDVRRHLHRCGWIGERERDRERQRIVQPGVIDAGGGATGGYVADRYFTGRWDYTFGIKAAFTTLSAGLPRAPLASRTQSPSLRGKSKSFCVSGNDARRAGPEASGLTPKARCCSPSHVVPVNTVADRTFIVTSVSTLICVFTRQAGDASVNAIEVRPVGTSAPPQVTLSATPTSVSVGMHRPPPGAASEHRPARRLAPWTGARATSGSWSTGSLSASGTYGLSCTGSGGSGTTRHRRGCSDPPRPSR